MQIGVLLWNFSPALRGMVNFEIDIPAAFLLQFAIDAFKTAWTFVISRGFQMQVADCKFKRKTVPQICDLQC